MKWIKASESIPSVGVYNALYNGDHVIFQVHDGGFRVINYHGEKDDTPRLNLIKYLYESEDQETSALRAENDRLRGLLEDRVRSHAYGVVCQMADDAMIGRPTDEVLQKECDKAWNYYKTENNL